MSESLAAQKGLTVNLPAVFGQPVAEIKPRFSTPYVVFAQPKAGDQWKGLLRHFPDLNDGDPVLVYPEPRKPERLSPFRCTLLHAKQYWSVVDKNQQGKELSQHAAEPDAGSLKANEGVAERIYTALIVYKDGAAIPATCLAKTVKCGAFVTLNEAVKMAMTPDWARNGADYEASVAACASPFARVVAQITVSGKPGNGNPYFPARAHISASGVAEWKALAELDPAALEAVAEAYQRFVGDLKLV